MTVRYRCPISVCGWSHEYVASASVPDCPADILSWSAVAWASMSEWTGSLLSVVQTIDGHLATHSSHEWMTELRRYQARAEEAEYELDQTLGALKAAKNFADAVDAVQTMRMPTRAEWEAAKTGLLALAGPANPQPEEYAS